MHRVKSVLVGLCIAVALSACGGGDRTDATADETGKARVVVSTTILADIVQRIAGDEVTIETLMPSGADPHHFNASARQAASMETADLVVVNGGGFEEGMSDLLESITADGGNVFTVTDDVPLLYVNDHLDSAVDVDHGDDEVGDDRDDTSGGVTGAADPHVWTDAHRMAIAAQAIGDTIQTLDGVDADAVASSTAATVADLEQLDADIAAQVAELAPERRILVTNHEAFNYYADRYGFTVVGTVIPSLTTNAEPSARDIEQLVGTVREYQVPAVFAETSSSTALAAALVREVGEIDGAPVEVVELYAESLGEPGSGADTYDAMMRVNTDRIVTALGGDGGAG